MIISKIQKDYLPMTESAYYILLSLIHPRHGYGIMQYVSQITQNRINIGAGTMYGTLSKMERDGLIMPVAEEERRKIYQVTPLGMDILKSEISRLDELLSNGNKEMRGV